MRISTHCSNVWSFKVYLMHHAMSASELYLLDNVLISSETFRVIQHHTWNLQLSEDKTVDTQAALTGAACIFMDFRLLLER